MKINGELGKVLSTSPEHRQWNCGMGIFKPGVVYWEENPEGRVIIDGKRCKMLSKTDYDKNYVLIGGKNYKIVKIGNQVWMAEDLNCTFDGIDIKQDGQLSNKGAMYYWNNTCFYNGNSLDKIIVPGWRIPTIDDFDILVEAVGGISVAGQKLKLSKWSGTNEFGFNGDCVGGMYASGYFGGDGQFVRYWSSTPQNSNIYYMQLRTADNAATAGRGSNYSAKNVAYSVRLLKDTKNTIKIGGREYNTVTIGGKIWTVENLDFLPDGVEFVTTGSETYTTPAACYYNFTDNGKGLLYNGYAIETINQLLPAGWRITHKSDFDDLFTIIGGNTADNIKKIRSTSGWPSVQGTDEYGLNIYSNGYRNVPPGQAFGSPGNAYLWTDTSDNNNFYRIRIEQSAPANNSVAARGNWYSIRLVKDA